MPYPELKAILTDIGSEELNHLEMVGTIVYQLTRNLSEEEIKKSGFDAYFVDHTTGVYPADASENPVVRGHDSSDWRYDYRSSRKYGGRTKARTTYDNILRFCDDPDVKDPIRFLRAGNRSLSTVWGTKAKRKKRYLTQSGSPGTGS